MYQMPKDILHLHIPYEISNLYIPYEFGQDVETADETDAMIEVEKQLRPEWDYRWGATQFVIMSDDWDYVFKIPFNGEWNYDCDEDNFYFEEFHHDYGERALERYDQAEDAGIGFLFASTQVACYSKNGYPIYVQPKVTTFSEVYYEQQQEKTEEERNSVKNFLLKNYNKDYNRLAIDWQYDVIKYYGEQVLKNLLDFIYDYETSVSDLHNDNFGYDKDGKPVILDYSDYLED